MCNSTRLSGVGLTPRRPLADRSGAGAGTVQDVRQARRKADLPRKGGAKRAIIITFDGGATALPKTFTVTIATAVVTRHPTAAIS